jgi:hypothetical protein
VSSWLVIGCTVARCALSASIMVAALALSTARVAAQSCCSLASEDEVSVVPPNRRAVLSSRIAAKHMLFRHDSEGQPHALADDVAATDLILTLGAGLRLPFYERLQLHGTMPLRAQLRTLPVNGTGGSADADHASAVGAGDANLYLRWSALYDDERGVLAEGASASPSLDLFVGTKLATGRVVEGPRASDNARTMGDGSVGLIGGVRALKYLTSSQGLRLTVLYDHRLAHDSDLAATGYESFAPGDQLGVSAGYWLLDGMSWLFGASLDVVWTLAAHANEPGQPARALANSEMRQTSLGLQVTRVLHMPDLELSVGLAADLPVPGISSNVSWEGVQAGVALRYHFMAPH